MNIQFPQGNSEAVSAKVRMVNQPDTSGVPLHPPTDQPTNIALKVQRQVQDINKSTSPETSNKDYALELIRENRGQDVLSDFSKFRGLDLEVAQALIKAGYGERLAYHFGKFDPKHHKEIAIALIEHGVIDPILEIFYFIDKSFDEDVAIALIRQGKQKIVLESLGSFVRLRPNALASALIQAGEVHGLASKLSAFNGLNQDVAQVLIDNGELSQVVNHLHSFQGLDENLAEFFINNGFSHFVAHHPKAFKALKSKKMAMMLIAGGSGWYVVNNLQDFQGIHHQEIAMQLVKKYESDLLVNNLRKFQGLNHQELVLEMIKVDSRNSRDPVVDYVDKFEGMGLDYHAVVMFLVEKRQYESVLKHLSRLPGVDHSAVMMKMIDQGVAIGYLARHLDKFRGLGIHVAQHLISQGQEELVRANMSRFAVGSEEILRACSIFEQRNKTKGRY